MAGDGDNGNLAVARVGAFVLVTLVLVALGGIVGVQLVIGWGLLVSISFIVALVIVRWGIK